MRKCSSACLQIARRVRRWRSRMRQRRSGLGPTLRRTLAPDGARRACLLPHGDETCRVQVAAGALCSPASPPMPQTSPSHANECSTGARRRHHHSDRRHLRRSASRPSFDQPALAIFDRRRRPAHSASHTRDDLRSEREPAKKPTGRDHSVAPTRVTMLLNHFSRPPASHLLRRVDAETIDHRCRAALAGIASRFSNDAAAARATAHHYLLRQRGSAVFKCVTRRPADHRPSPFALRAPPTAALNAVTFLANPGGRRGVSSSPWLER